MIARLLTYLRRHGFASAGRDGARSSALSLQGVPPTAARDAQRRCLAACSAAMESTSSFAASPACPFTHSTSVLPRLPS